MEAFNVPITAIVSIIMCFTALGFTFVGNVLSDEPSVKISRPADPVYSTQGSRLLFRHMQDSTKAPASLIEEFKKYYGGRASAILLQNVEETLSLGGQGLKEDMLYSIRGYALLDLQRQGEAEKSFNEAMNLNPASNEARDGLNIIMEQRRLTAEAAALTEEMNNGPVAPASMEPAAAIN